MGSGGQGGPGSGEGPNKRAFPQRAATPQPAPPPLLGVGGRRRLGVERETGSSSFDGPQGSGWRGCRRSRFRSQM